MTTARHLPLACLLLIPVVPFMNAEEENAPGFSSPVVDLGIVVSDLEQSVEFYKEVLGCKELDGFSVPAAFGSDLGLSDHQPLKVRVLTPGEGEHRTRLKLMSFPERRGVRTDQTFIHSSLGFSYLTFRVTDLDASIARLREARVKLEGKSPLPLGNGVHILLCRDPDGNFVELIGPRATGSR